MPLVLNEELMEQAEAQFLKYKMQNTDWKFEVFKSKILEYLNNPEHQPTFNTLIKFIENASTEQDLIAAVGGFLLNFQTIEVQLREIFKAEDIKFPSIVDIMRKFSGGAC